MKKYPPRTHNRVKHAHPESHIAAIRFINRTLVGNFRHTPMPMLKQKKV